MKKGIAVIAVLIVVSVVGNLFWRRIDMWRFPWGYEGSGKPTLTGTWVGSVTTATGQHRGVIIEIRLPDISNRRQKSRQTRFGNFEGAARTCDERGQIRSFTVYGNPENREATNLHLATTPAETPAPEGLTLSNAKGLWDQGNTLHLQASFYFRKDGGSITGADYPDTQKDALLHMTRGGDAEFRRVCDATRAPGA